MIEMGENLTGQANKNEIGRDISEIKVKGNAKKGIIQKDSEGR